MIKASDTCHHPQPVLPTHKYTYQLSLDRYSYGGHYVPAVGHKIFEANKEIAAATAAAGQGQKQQQQEPQPEQQRVRINLKVRRGV